MKKLLLVFTIVFFSGCTGIITGHQYTEQDGIVLYKITKKGITTFMSAENIQKLNLDDMDNAIIDGYGIYKGK